MPQSRTDFVLLGLLTVQDGLSGYDLRKAIESSIGYFWSESFGQIYPTLKRLGREGLVTPAPKSQRRQQYSITPAGRAALDAWLQQPFYNEPPRNEFLLKLFFAGQVPPAVSIAHIRDLNQKNRAALATLEQLEKVAHNSGVQNPNYPYWMLTLDLGLALTRAALAWGESALRQLECAAQPATGPHTATTA